MKKVIILATGGTIAGAGAAGAATNYSAGELSVGQLIAGAPGIDRLAEINCVQVCNVSSDDITGSHLLRLAREINAAAGDASVAGFVITHGTNTMTETAYFLNLTVKTDKPVVLTGAIRPATALSADGPVNLYEAVAAASNPACAGRGVLIIFDGGIYGARDIHKISTRSAAAFGGRDAGELGYMLEGSPRFYRRSDRAHTTRSEFDVDKIAELPAVAILYAHQDADPDILDWAAARHAGIVIAGMGSGCYSEPWNDRVATLSLPVVRASRVSNGPNARDDFYDQYPHVLPADDLPPQKARILLQLGLTVTSSPERLREMFARY